MGTLSSPRRILITGASRGIGACTAQRLARLGHTVVLAARTETDLCAVRDAITAEGGTAEVLVMDVADPASVRAGIDRMLATGPCDVVVNNAATCEQAAFLDRDPDGLRAEMSVGYWGAQHVVRAVASSMIDRQQGVIVNVSSLLGFVGTPTTANYSATKAALNAWTHALRSELAPHGVRVVLFVAPHTQTEMGARIHFDGVVSLPVEYVADKLVRAIDRAPRQFVASPVYALFVALAGWAPRFMEVQLARSASVGADQSSTPA